MEVAVESIFCKSKTNVLACIIIISLLLPSAMYTVNTDQDQQGLVADAEQLGITFFVDNFKSCGVPYEARLPTYLSCLAYVQGFRQRSELRQL